jgi:UDP-glucose 4-epimerase
MKVVVFGATGNVGTSVVRALSEDPKIERIVGVARRLPRLEVPRTEWVQADITTSPLAPILEEADAAIHLAWAIQPSRDENALRATNVDGSVRVLDAVAKARVPTLIYASSVGTYSPGPKDRTVDESWPTDGIGTSFYSCHKAEVEGLLDEFERGEPGVRVVRLRPGLIFKREAATEIRRLFLGPLVPRIAFSKRALFVVPDIPDLRFQAVHTDDVAEAYRLALHTLDARGAYNVAARIVRGIAAATWRARLQPTPEGWLDMALGVPLMSSDRARDELGWMPRRNSTEALDDLLTGLRTGAGVESPPLDPASSGPARANEFRTGVGAKAF